VSPPPWAWTPEILMEICHGVKTTTAIRYSKTKNPHCSHLCLVVIWQENAKKQNKTKQTKNKTQVKCSVVEQTLQVNKVFMNTTNIYGNMSWCKNNNSNLQGKSHCSHWCLVVFWQTKRKKTKNKWSATQG